MDTKNTAKLEALLFIYGEAMSYKKLAHSLNLEEEKVKMAVEELRQVLAERRSGLMLTSDKEKVQLVTRPEFSLLIEEILKEELKEELSPASLETLSIVAYSAPISRAELEYIRGVNSSFILRNLLIRGLIERAPDPQRPNAFAYSTSINFLKFLGVSKTEDLPEYAKLSQLIQTLRKADESKKS